MPKRPSRPASRPKSSDEPNAPSLYDRIGAEKVERLVAVFYARVDHDPVIRPFYGKTLTCAIHGLTNFLIRWLGGPPTYELHRARLSRRHAPFAIDARARDAWLSHMKAAVQEVEIAPADARLLLAHLEFGARALVNTGEIPSRLPCPAEKNRFDPRLAEQWNRMIEVEDLFDAISRGDLDLLQTMLPKRLVPHAEFLSHALALSLDPLDRKGRRYSHQIKRAKPLEMVEFLLAQRDLDIDPAAGDDLGRFRHLQSMIEAYARGSQIVAGDERLFTLLRAQTRDQFMALIQRARSSVRLLGLRGQTLLHEAAMAGAAEFSAALLRIGADPDAKELEGHTPLYRASTVEVAQVLLAAGATVDAASGPTQGTPLHQAARRGNVSVAAALLDHGANIEARDNKGQTPLRRAVNCGKIELVQLLIERGANPRAMDKRGKKPLDAVRTLEMKRALSDTEQ